MCLTNDQSQIDFGYASTGGFTLFQHYDQKQRGVMLPMVDESAVNSHLRPKWASRSTGVGQVPESAELQCCI